MSEQKQGLTQKKEIKRKTRIVLASGKRKKAIARAIVYPGEGIVRINGRRLEALEIKYIRGLIEEPLLLIGDLRNTINIKVRVTGGGISGQAQAARVAIARALVKYFENENLHEIFRTYDRHLLIEDFRRKEMKKYGGPGARARFQKSYR